MPKSGSTDFIVDHPWITLLLSLAVVIASATQLVKLQPSISYQDMLGPDHPKLIDYEVIQQLYTRDDNLLVLIEARDGDAFDEDTLAAVRNLSERLWQTPFSIRVDSITNFQYSAAAGDALEVGDLVPESGEMARRSDEVRRIAMAEPLLLNRATNAAGNVVAASVSFAFPNRHASEKLDAYAFVNDLADDFEHRFPGLVTHVSGLIALDATVMEISQRETALFLLLVIGIVMILLAAFMRALAPVILSIVVCLFSIVLALSLAGFMGWKLTPFTASVPLVILIIGVADCVHLITGYLQRLRGEDSKIEALKYALAKNFRPIAITSLTTATGFLSLNFSDSAGVQALGNEVAFGVMAAFAFSVTFLPAALCLLPGFRRGSAQTQHRSTWPERLANGVNRHRSAILGLTALSIVGLATGIPRNAINDIIPHYFDVSLSWRQANDFAEAEFGGAYTFAWSLRTDGSTISDPAFLAQAETFVDWLRQRPDVVYVNSVTDTFKRLNRNMHGDDPDFYRLPADPALGSQYLLLYEMSLPFGLDLDNQITWDKQALKVQATFRTLSTSEILIMERDVDNWLASRLPGIAVTGSGVQLMFAHLLDKDVTSLLLGTTISLIVISFCLILAFRSLRLGLISLAPNLIPALAAFGVWGYFVGQVGIGLAMVSGMTIGIIVDDTVHFLYKYHLARREQGLEVEAAIAYAYRQVGPAIGFTTIVLVAGFLAITMLAQFRVNSDMATMTSIVLLFALIFDLIALPALLCVVDTVKSPRAASIATQQI